MSHVLRLSTTELKQIVDLTDQVQGLIRQANLKEGLCTVFVTHTRSPPEKSGKGPSKIFFKLWSR